MSLPYDGLRDTDKEKKMSTAEDVKAVLEGRREFVFEVPGANAEAKVYFIGTPTGEDIRKADWEYSKVYNQAIIDGFLTQSQMTEILREKGIISDEYAEALETARVSLGAEIFKLEHMVTDVSDDEREAMAVEVGRLRDELFILNQKVNGPMANTCENLAEDARTDYITSRVVQLSDGSLVWEKHADYRNDENTGLVVRSRFEVMLWLQGLESNFLENTPEQKTLRSVALKRVEAEEEARLEEEEKEEKKTKTKRTRKAKVASRSKGTPDPVVVEDIELPALDEVVEEEAEKPKPTRKGRPKGSKNKPKTDE